MLQRRYPGGPLGGGQGSDNVVGLAEVFLPDDLGLAIDAAA
jgi:hypothetical protein